ncbi:hypothetical protein [Roseateles sp. BYS87W]|uniref:Uncharacterized protein n=1 Tax=Pelomonas baiyunensis TaxID=3299026 RepID=A0ABW7H233_9BURK
MHHKERPPAEEKQRGNGRWFAASLLFFGLTVIALFLLWNAGPFVSKFPSPEMQAKRWHLPDWLWLSSFATVLLATPSALICAAVGLAKAKQRRLQWQMIVTLVVVSALLAIAARVVAS